jgi:hypothetical protein
MTAIVAAALATGCATQPRPDCVVTRDPRGPPIVGVGACMNPYVHAYPNWPAEVNERNVADFERKVKDVHPQFVRIFFLNSWWEDDTDPVIAKHHPGMRQALIRTVRLGQEAGAKVLLQFWYDPKRYADPGNVARRFVRAVADLRNQYGLTAVRFVTMQNEPNDNGKDVTPSQYVQLYRELDRALRDAGLRNDVQIIGGDLVSVNQADWVNMLGRDLSPVLDGYSMHAYWAFWNTPKLQQRIHDTQQQVDALPPDQRRPLYATEFGVQGNRPRPGEEPGTYKDGRPLADVPEADAQIAWFVLDALNHGFVGFCQWDLYEAWYDRKMGYGVIGPAERGFPTKPGYDLLAMFTEGIKPGDRVVSMSGGNKAVITTGISDGTDVHALFILNHSDKTQRVTIGRLPAQCDGVVSEWNGRLPGAIADGGTAQSDRSGVLSLTVPPHALLRWQSTAASAGQ